jgi:hypothetical protein
VSNLSGERRFTVEHVVFYADAHGASVFHRTPDRAAALSFVEQLVNESGGACSPEVHVLTPVSVRMRTVFVAQVDAEQSVAAAEPAPVAATAAEPGAPEPGPFETADLAAFTPPPPAVPEQAGGGAEPAFAGVGAASSSDPVAEVVPAPESGHPRSFGFFSR